MRPRLIVLILCSLVSTMLLGPAAVTASTTWLPWRQIGNDAGHSHANAGPSPAADNLSWTSSTGGGLNSVMAVDGGLVAAARPDAVLLLDQQDGTLVRALPVMPSTVAIAGGQVVVIEGGGMVRAFALTTGTQNWATMTGPIAGGVVHQGRVFVKFVDSALGNGKVRALDLVTGGFLWEAGVPGSASSPPSAAGDRVFQSTADGGVVLAFDAATGAQLWSAPVGVAVATPVADATRLFVGTNSGHFLALRQDTGAVLWDTAQGAEYAGGTANGLAFGLAGDGTLHAFHSTTGAHAWSHNIGGGLFPSALASAGGRGFFSTHGSAPALYAVDLDTGTILWSRPETDAPIIADGLVFAQSGGEIVAIGTPTAGPLTVAMAGTGHGTVISDPPGIDCGSTCSAAFDDSASVTLTATAGPGSTFVGWTGEGCSGTEACTITMDAARTVTATFTMPFQWAPFAVHGHDVRSILCDPTQPATMYVGTRTYGVFKSEDGGQSWAERNAGLTDTDVWTLVMDPSQPSTLYAGTHAGLVFKSTDGAATWQPSGGGMGEWVSRLAIDPVTPTILYAATWGAGVYRSADGGASWAPASANLPGFTYDVAIDPLTPTTLYASGDQGLSKSTDSGATWYTVKAIAHGRDIAIDPITPTTVYFTAANGAGIFRSTDGGGTWEAKNAGIATPGFGHILIEAGNPRTLYATVHDVGVYKSSTAGEAWEPLGSGLTFTYMHILTAHPANPHKLYVGTMGGGLFQGFSPVLLAVSRVGTGVGTVVSDFPGIDCGDDCGETFAAGDTMTLTATPNAGSTFVGWTGGGCTSTGTCTMTMDRASTVTATFNIINTLPAVPTLRAQLKSDGTTPIPLGGTVPPQTVVFRATVSDPDAGQTVRIQAEVKPVGTVFTGEVSCQSPLVATGTAASCSVSGLALGSYHWRLRAMDSLGTPGSWASYARNVETDADFVVNTKPAIPTGRSQRQSDGTTPIPLGGWAASSTVVFRGTVSDADVGQTVRLQVEVKPVSVAFTGTPSCESGLVPSGTAATCQVTGLAPGPYHWRLRAKDSLGESSGWVSYATNAETAADFVVNTRPAVPMTRFQRQADGTTPIPLSGAATSPTVILGATVSDPDAGQSVCIQVEIKPVSTPFDGTVSCQGALVTSGTATNCSVTGLIAGAAYHWRLRARDSWGAVSAWASYATNAESAPDFMVDTAPRVPTARAQFQANGTTPIPLGGTATTATVVFHATVSDPDAGQTVRLQVEVQPLGTAFTGAVSCQSAFVPSGTATSCAVTGLTPGAGYHWRLRSVDNKGGVSAWASYARNAESAADFVVNALPGVPTGRGQRQADGITPIGLGGRAFSTTVVFLGMPSDPDPGRTVRLQVEVQPLGTALTGAVHCQSALVPSGTATRCSVAGLTPGTAYHWQTRTVDDRGMASAWAPYATNPEDAADFAVSVLTAPLVPGQINSHAPSGTIDYHWYSYVPPGVNKLDRVFILVTGLGTPPFYTDYSEEVAQQLQHITGKVPYADHYILLTPVVPQYCCNGIATWALSHETLVTPVSFYRRPDVRLNLMIDELKARLANDGYVVSGKVFLEGFSGGCMFAQRYALLHPQRVHAIAGGQCGASVTIPGSVYNDSPMQWPVGVNDFFALLGYPFNFDGYRQIPHFIYIGEQDTGSSTVTPGVYDVFTQEQQAFLNANFGTTPLVRLGNETAYMRQLGCDVTFRVYPGVAHHYTPEIINDIYGFFARVRSRYAPTATITTPTAAWQLLTNYSSLAITGTASVPDGRVAGVKWSNDRGGNGSCTGTTEWSCTGIPLYAGQNLITVTVADAVGNMARDELLVERYLGEEPTLLLAITSPTMAEYFVAGIPEIALGGSAWTRAADIAGVSWSDDRGGHGSCAGTTQWNCYAIPLRDGRTSITVTVEDTAGRTATDTLTVN
jgi:outer membrane protein assembly factor BamB